MSAAILAAVYLTLSHTIDAGPLDAVTVKKFVRTSGGIVEYRPGEQFRVADLESVQRAVNQNTLDTLRTASIVALAVIFVLSLVIGWFVAGRLLRPIERITDTAREITATDLSRRIAASGPADELRTLADTIDDMLARLETAFRAERDLVEDVSHELRNPVAVVQANVEAVLADEQSSAAERADAMAIITRATARMTRLLEDLLATARRRSGAFTDRELDLATLVTDTAEEYRFPAEERTLDLRVRAPSGRSSTRSRSRWGGRSATCCPTRPDWHRAARRSPSRSAACRGGRGPPCGTRAPVSRSPSRRRSSSDSVGRARGRGRRTVVAAVVWG